MSSIKSQSQIKYVKELNSKPNYPLIEIAWILISEEEEGDEWPVKATDTPIIQHFISQPELALFR